MNDERFVRIFGFFTSVAICLFLIPWVYIWIKKSRDSNRAYTIVIYDMTGHILYLDGIRVDFRTVDVAWSFMKEYKHTYPHYSFGLVSNGNNSEPPTLIRYL